MMKITVLVFTFFVISIAADASAACEKWKSEMASVGASIGSYIHAYTKRDGTFSDKANRAIDKLLEIQGRAKSIESCADSDNKYEKRRLNLLRVINISLPIMRAGKYLSPSVKDDLRE
jgi:hypothetical protein